MRSLSALLSHGSVHAHLSVATSGHRHTRTVQPHEHQRVSQKGKLTLRTSMSATPLIWWGLLLCREHRTTYKRGTSQTFHHLKVFADFHASHPTRQRKQRSVLLDGIFLPSYLDQHAHHLVGDFVVTRRLLECCLV